LSIEKALLVPANPFKYKEMGDVEFHKAHLNRNGGVFWDLIPMGRRDAPWKHPEIKSGYFYISKVQVVEYWMSIECIKRWKEVDLGEVERYIPEPRKAYLQSDPQTKTYYAILIKDIRHLNREHKHKLNEFTLASSNQKVERVQNYAIVVDPGWR